MSRVQPAELPPPTSAGSGGPSGAFDVGAAEVLFGAVLVLGAPEVLGAADEADIDAQAVA